MLHACTRRCTHTHMHALLIRGTGKRCEGTASRMVNPWTKTTQRPWANRTSQHTRTHPPTHALTHSHSHAHSHSHTHTHTHSLTHSLTQGDLRIRRGAQEPLHCAQNRGGAIEQADRDDPGTVSDHRCVYQYIGNTVNQYSSCISGMDLSVFLSRDYAGAVLAHTTQHNTTHTHTHTHTHTTTHAQNTTPRS